MREERMGRSRRMGGYGRGGWRAAGSMGEGRMGGMGKGRIGKEQQNQRIISKLMKQTYAGAILISIKIISNFKPN